MSLPPDDSNEKAGSDPGAVPHPKRRRGPFGSRPHKKGPSGAVGQGGQREDASAAPHGEGQHRARSASGGPLEGGNRHSGRGKPPRRDRTTSPESDPLPIRSEAASIVPPPQGRGSMDPGGAGVKLQKVLADAGIGSRRDMEELILAGRVSVNGLPAHIGQRIASNDQVRINGRTLPRKLQPPPPRVLLYHKPSGEICTRDDPDQRPTVFHRLPRIQGARWVAVGRLDFNTEGLLIFTTSGDIANRLMHPRYGWEREYAVRILGRIDEETKARLLEGVELEDGLARFNSLEDVGGDGANHWYRVTLSEGRNREIRRIFDAVQLSVSRLARIRFGPIGLPDGLPRARYVELDEAEIRRLQQLLRDAESPNSGTTPAATVRRSEGSASAASGQHPKPATPLGPSYERHEEDAEAEGFDLDTDHEDAPPPGFDPAAYLPRYADEPEEADEREDEEWQPRNANAHLEGITRSLRKSLRAPTAVPAGLKPPGKLPGEPAAKRKKRRQPSAAFNLAPGVYQPPQGGMGGNGLPARGAKQGPSGSVPARPGPYGPKSARGRKKTGRAIPKPD